MATLSYNKAMRIKIISLKFTQCNMLVLFKFSLKSKLELNYHINIYVKTKLKVI